MKIDHSKVPQTGDDELQEQQAGITYGIPSLDDCLGRYREPGYLHLFSGFPGSKKEVLASQLLVENVMLNKKVLVISTKSGQRDYMIRCLSNGLKIPYDENMRVMYDKQNGGEFPVMLDVNKYNEEECLKSLVLLQKIIHNSYIYRVPSDSVGLSMDIIHDVIDNCECFPEIIILDDLKCKAEHDNPHAQRNAMEEVMDYLHTVSHEIGCNVVVIAQASPKYTNMSKVPLNATIISNNLHTFADVSMAMSWLAVPDIEESEGLGYTNESYLREQFLNVNVRGSSFFLAVDADYERSTLRQGEHETDQQQRDHINARRDKRKAYEIVQRGKMCHYVWIGRSVFERVKKIDYPPAVNVYIFHLLAANKAGLSWYSFKSMAEIMGLSVEQIRTAVDKLKKAKLLEGVGKKRDMKRRVMKQDENAAFGDDTGAIKLNQTMLLKHSTIMLNPHWFRLWLHLLFSAHSGFDSPSSRPGDVTLNLAKLDLKLAFGEDVPSALRTFIRDKRIKILSGDLGGSGVVQLRLVNWMVYQYDVPSALSAGLGRKGGR
ncbi:hypothetical protein NT6N_02680 [Oceaniferula spumae]|uniref:SF4 helicase domain-containing protein n=1 Tax=Oceaniferula spumae TaxID=2979115 RepID=A0AAT9FGY9_9BACT